MIADAMSSYGHSVVQYISNFEHRSKSFRSSGYKSLQVRENYTIEIIPSTPYTSHISLKRIHYERTFARNILKKVRPEKFPDVIILAEPALFYYDVLLKPLIVKSNCKLVLDIIDIWPELFQIALPAPIRPFSTILLCPLYFWRKRLYQFADAIVAVSHDYLQLAKNLTSSARAFEVVYWSYPAQEQSAGNSNDPLISSLIALKAKGEVWIIYAGTLGENYDIPSIIKVAHALTKKIGSTITFKFIVAGDGPLKAICEKTTIPSFVFLGRLSADDLKTLYPHCDIALSSYKGESTVAMPIKAFDYLKFGLPIVNSLGKDLGQLIRMHRVGINYDPDSPESLYEAICKLLTDTQFRHECSARAKIVAQEFSSDIQYKKFVDLVNRLN